jgi:hypothetical protein
MITANVSELKDFLSEILTINALQEEYFKTPAPGRKPERLKALRQREKTVIKRAQRYYQQLLKEIGHAE